MLLMLQCTMKRSYVWLNHIIERGVIIYILHNHNSFQTNALMNRLWVKNMLEYISWS